MQAIKAWKKTNYNKKQRKHKNAQTRSIVCTDSCNTPVCYTPISVYSNSRGLSGRGFSDFPYLPIVNSTAHAWVELIGNDWSNWQWPKVTEIDWKWLKSTETGWKSMRIWESGLKKNRPFRFLLLKSVVLDRLVVSSCLFGGHSPAKPQAPKKHINIKKWGPKIGP